MPSNTATSSDFSELVKLPGGSYINYVSTLHNYLQQRKEAHLLSWAEMPSRPPNVVQWIVHCKVAGEIMGTGMGVQKSTARQAAAKQAYEALLAGKNFSQ